MAKKYSIGQRVLVCFKLDLFVSDRLVIDAGEYVGVIIGPTDKLHDQTGLYSVKTEICKGLSWIVDLMDLNDRAEENKHLFSYFIKDVVI